jgi:hypothetical protein
MKKVLILGLALALVGGAAYANFCSRDFVPASTLLVPYAIVGLQGDDVTPDPNGWTTILDVTNVSSAKQLIHVVVWDALSEAVIDFDEVLSGYDVWQINFRDLLAGNFNLFDTGDYDGSDNGNGPKPPSQPEIGDFWKGTLGTVVSPWAGAGMTGYPTQFGPSSNSIFTASTYPPGGGAPNLLVPQDIDYPVPSNGACNFPYGTAYTSLGPTVVGLLQAAQVPGIPQDGSLCVGAATIASPDWLTHITDNPVWFYVTVDVVNSCNQNFPNTDSVYWTTPYPTANNTIIGNIFYLNPNGNFSDSIPAVSIEGDFDWQTYGGWNGGAQTVGFYSAYSESFKVHDWHEPLPTAYAFEYYNGGGITSNLMAWKNYTEWLDWNLDGVLDGPDAWDACLPYIYYAWDQNENCKARGTGGPSGFGTAEPNALPFQTQKVPLTPANFDGIPASAGWMLLVFEPSIGAQFGITAPFEPYLQAWAGVQYYWGTYSTELEAATLGNYWCFTSDVMPQLNTNNSGVPPYTLNHVHPY